MPAQPGPAGWPLPTGMGSMLAECPVAGLYGLPMPEPGNGGVAWPFWGSGDLWDDPLLSCCGRAWYPWMVSSSGKICNQDSVVMNHVT